MMGRQDREDLAGCNAVMLVLFFLTVLCVTGVV